MCTCEYVLWVEGRKGIGLWSFWCWVWWGFGGFFGLFFLVLILPYSSILSPSLKLICEQQTYTNSRFPLCASLHSLPAQTRIPHLSFPTTIQTCISLPRKQIK